MSRKPFIAGNWNEQKSRRSKAFVEAVVSNFLHQTLLKRVSQLQLFDLTTVLAAAKAKILKLPWFKNRQATFEMQVLSLVKQFTSLKEIGTDYVVIGHLRTP